MLKRKMQAERDIPCERETESKNETEREIESVWESLIARLRKSERVEREIERVSDERVAVGMWVS